MLKPVFESRRTGYVFKTAEELNKYFDDHTPGFDENGDLVIQNIWKHNPSEVRVMWVVNGKIPKEILKRSSDDWEVVKIRYVRAKNTFKCLFFDSYAIQYAFVEFQLFDNGTDDIQIKLVKCKYFSFSDLLPTYHTLGFFAKLMMSDRKKADDAYAAALQWMRRHK
jgi:hypothetical protein